ncbi:MAG: DUF2306 domain-containing protein [Microlunatus sp.]
MTSTVSSSTAAPSAAVRSNRLRRVGWMIMTVLALGVGGYAVALVASGFRLVPGEIAANRFPTPLGLRIHIVASGLALLSGPFQFARGLRTRLPMVHRWLGRTYVVSCLVGGVSGGAIALFSTSGLIAGFGFLCLAICWVGATLMGFAAIRGGDVGRHRRWMIRSFALTYAAVMLRIYLPIAMELGMQFAHAYPAIAWLCWLPNLVVAQWLINRPVAISE